MVCNVELSLSAGNGVGESAGEAASGIAEDEAWVLVVLGVLLAVAFGAGIFPTPTSFLKY